MNPQEPNPQIPSRLQESLRGAYRSADFPGTDAAFDREMQAMAAKVAAGAGARRKASQRRWRRNLLTGLAAALAAGTVTAWFVWSGSQPRPAGVVASGDPRDLNGDGRIDMLDALLLAERVDSGGPGKAERQLLDLNADGRVDSRDAGVLAADAVALTRGTL